MVEAVAARDLMTGATTDWDVVPQIQVTVSRRQHVRGNRAFGAGYQYAGRPTQLMMYFLWDWADGGLFEGWK